MTSADRIVHTRETFGAIPEGTRLADRVFDRCTFTRSWTHAPPEGLLRAERLDFLSCAVRAQRGFADVECHEILVRGMAKKSAVLMPNELLLDRVTLEGDFTKEICFFWTLTTPSPRTQYAERFYASLPSFAIDVRKARFSSLSLRGVPGHLVLRDPETSALVHRDRLEADPSWATRDEWGHPIGSVTNELDLFLRHEPKWPSCVIVVGVLGKRAEKQRAELDDLKRRGFAE